MRDQPCLNKLEINSTNKDIIWSLIWSSKVAPKIKYFIWKLVHGFIPTKVNLQEKTIPIDDLCVVCGREREMVCHIMLECALSREV